MSKEEGAIPLSAGRPLMLLCWLLKGKVPLPLLAMVVGFSGSHCQESLQEWLARNSVCSANRQSSVCTSVTLKGRPIAATQSEADRCAGKAECAYFVGSHGKTMPIEENVPSLLACSVYLGFLRKRRATIMRPLPAAAWVLKPPWRRVKGRLKGTTCN